MGLGLGEMDGSGSGRYFHLLNIQFDIKWGIDGKCEVSRDEAVRAPGDYGLPAIGWLAAGYWKTG